MTNINIVFSRILLKGAREDFAKNLPLKYLKKMIGYKTLGGCYNVEIPPNEYFKEGYTWYGRAGNVYEAKSKAIFNFLENNFPEEII